MPTKKTPSQRGRASREKGARGELELAKYLKEAGFMEAARGRQFKGGGDSPDAVGLPGIHIEVKRAERLALHDAADQSRRDSAGSGNIPIVVYRCNRVRGTGGSRGDWFVIQRLDDWIKTSGPWLARQKVEESI